MKNPTTEKNIQEEAIELAEAWQNRANELMTAEERAYQGQIQHLLTHPQDKVTLTRMIDRSFRSANHRKTADQISTLLQKYGIPGFFFANGKNADAPFSFGRPPSARAVRPENHS